MIIKMIITVLTLFTFGAVNFAFAQQSDCASKADDGEGEGGYDIGIYLECLEELNKNFSKLNQNVDNNLQELEKRVIELEKSLIYNSLIAQYSFDKCDQDGFQENNEESENDFHGIIKGDSLPTCKPRGKGKALVFNGNNFIEIPSNPYFNTPELTVSLWFERDELLTDENYTLISKDQVFSLVVANQIAEQDNATPCEPLEQTDLIYYTKYILQDEWKPCSTGKKIDVNDSMHVILTASLSGGVAVYLNGEPLHKVDHQQELGLVRYSKEGGCITIAASGCEASSEDGFQNNDDSEEDSENSEAENSEASDYFKGMIDEVKIFNRAFLPNEAKKLYGYEEQLLEEKKVSSE